MTRCIILGKEHFFLLHLWPAFLYLQILYYLTQLHFTIEFCRVCWYLPGQMPNLGDLICVYATAFKINIPPLNCSFWRSVVRITLIKPSLCLNSIFPIRKQCFIKKWSPGFSIVWKICKISFTETTAICKLIIRLVSNFDTCDLKISILWVIWISFISGTIYDRPGTYSVMF